MSGAISVVVPTYLRPAHIKPLMDTLAQQTVQPTEIIIVDDAQAGDAKTEDIVKRLAQTCPISQVQRHS